MSVPNPLRPHRAMVRTPPLPLLLAALLAVLLPACGGPETGPAEIHWDRDTCERCHMVLSDRHHSAQIRGGPEGGRARVYKFDDIGCAVLWLEEQPWKDDPRTEIWVNDHRDGQWIDARRAHYVTGQETPMDYGLGAQDEPAEGALNYEQAKAHIRKVEERFSEQGVDIEHGAH